MLHNNYYLDTTIVTTSCTILDQVLNYLFERLAPTAATRQSILKEPEGNNCLIALEKNSSLLAEVTF